MDRDGQVVGKKESRVLDFPPVTMKLANAGIGKSAGVLNYLMWRFAKERQVVVQCLKIG